MPLYEYRCDQCPALVEQFRDVRESDALEVCTACDGDPRYFMFGVLQRVYTPPVLRGQTVAKT